MRKLTLILGLVRFNSRDGETLQTKARWLVFDHLAQQQAAAEMENWRRTADL